MGMIAKLTCATSLLVACSILGTPAAQAGPTVHLYFPESYDATEHFEAGEGPCVPWSGSFREVREGGYRLLLPPGGQLPPETHLNGAVDGVVELVPDDPALPTYTGTYREKVNGVLTAGSLEDDSLRVGQYRLRSRLIGSDGSSLVLELSGKLTVDARGRVAVSRDAFSCG